MLCEVLSLAIFPSVGLAGCLDQLAATSSDSTSLPDPVSELEFEITDTDFDPRADPVISFPEEADEATVEGTIWVGSKKCNEATLTDVSFDRADGSVELRISPGKSDEHPNNRLLGGSCDDVSSSICSRSASIIRQRISVPLRTCSRLSERPLAAMLGLNS